MLVDLLKQNNEKMNFARRFDESPLIFPDNDLSGEVFQFIYSQPGAEIDIPTARLIWINQYAGIVTEITIDTSEQKGTLAELYTQLHALRKSLLDAHWKEVEPMRSYDDVQAVIARSEGTTTDFGTAKYKKGNTEALIMLATPGAVMTPDKAGQASFVAEIWFHDEILSKQQSDKTFAARKKVNGNDGISLPLSYWIDSNGQIKNPVYPVSQLVRNSMLNLRVLGLLFTSLRPIHLQRMLSP